MSKIKLNTLALCISLTVLKPSIAMEFLSDEDLSKETGQALYGISYIAPGADGNPTTGINANVGFYRVALNADVEINMNVNKYYLGCSGDINSASVATRNCDVDIDNIRFSGIETPQTTKNRDTAPDTDFIMKNPFMELAIRNPNTKATRELIGLRTGAEQAKGVMAFGDRPYNTDGTAMPDSNPNNHSGMNRLSGFMDIWLGDGVNQNVTALCQPVSCLTSPPAPGTGMGQGTGIIRIAIGGVWSGPNNPNSWGVVQAFPNGRPAITYTDSRCSINIGLFGNSTGCAAGRQDPALPVGANIFPRQYSARSNTLTLGVVQTLTNIRALGSNTVQLSKARMSLDTRLIHRIQVGDATTYAPFDTFLSKVGDRALTTPTNNNSDPVDTKPTNPANWLKWKNLTDGSWDAVPLGWSMGLGKVVTADYRSDTLDVGAIAGLGTLSVVNIDMLQIPTDNCYGNKTFC